MDRYLIIKNLKKYFQIYELVGPRTYKKYKEDAWQFLETEALHCLLITRELIDDKCTVNNWFWGGKFKESGLRTNLQSIFRNYFKRGILYLSGHPLGCAFDLKFKNTLATKVREIIIENQHLYPCKIRLENLKNGKPISWTHIDTKQLERNPKVLLFNV